MLIQRDTYIQKIQSAFELQPIVVLIGARQVGKTSIMQSLKIEAPKLTLDGQDSSVAEIFQKYSDIETYLKLNLNADLNGYLIIDEFQFISGVSTMMKLLTDHNPQLKILCSGSSSLDILQKVEESLSGRTAIIEVFSLSFEEYLKFCDINLYNKYLQYDENVSDIVVDKAIAQKINKYVVFGGLPRTALTSDLSKKVDLLDGIYKTYLLKDVRNYVKNEDVIGYNKLLRLISTQIGNIININELATTSGLPYKKCEEYLYLLEQMYIIKLVEPYFTNKRKTITKMKKVYFNDLGLRNVIYKSFNPLESRADNGALYENFIFLELCRIVPESATINYYRTLDGSEVDFVISTMFEKISIEVKYKQINKPISVRNLTIFNELEGVQKSYLINQNFNCLNDSLKYLQGYLTGKIKLK